MAVVHTVRLMFIHGSHSGEHNLLFTDLRGLPVAHNTSESRCRDGDIVDTVAATTGLSVATTTKGTPMAATEIP